MEQRLSGKRILVVEDEYFIAADVKRALEREGAEVIGPTGILSDGLQLAAEERIDAAILDINLGGQPSFDVAERLRAAHVPHMFLTGYDDWSIPDQHNATPRLTKPCPAPLVLGAVIALVATPQ